MAKSVCQGSWARDLSGKWKIKIDPKSGRGLLKAGKVVDVQVVRKDGTFQQIPARIEGILKTKKGTVYSIIASPTRQIKTKQNVRPDDLPIV